MRDFQREKVYAAENVVRAIFERQHECPTVHVAGSTITLPAEKRFGDIDSIQRYVNLVAGKHVSVRPGRTGQKKAWGGPTYGITIPTARVSHKTPWAMREIVVLHELAHVLNHSGDRHGPEFVKTFAELVEKAMSPEAALLLRVNFYESGVK